ncbi:MAG: hypothetical protein HY693_00110 [Deltaproteobacteria bacterium]|nr:hypothetical protein [Deltaproteobacteria bacterium]
MGLIDDIRKKRDSWTARLEEHRKDVEEHDFHNSDVIDNIDDLIMKNRSKVGNYPKKEEL